MALSEERLQLLLTKHLKASAVEAARRKGVSLGEYVRSLIEADLRQEPPGRRGAGGRLKLPHERRPEMNPAHRGGLMAATDPLTGLRVASPCDMSWEAMEGNDRARHCSKCRLTVYDISGMTRDEAAALIRAREGRLCVRFFRRADGTVLTRDCPWGFRAARRRVLALAASGAAALATLSSWAVLAAPGLRRSEPFASWLRWIERSPRTIDDDGEVFLGDMAVEEPEGDEKESLEPMDDEAEDAGRG
jgi:hypothetical protein